MHWTLADLWSMPVTYYDDLLALVDEWTAERP